MCYDAAMSDAPTPTPPLPPLATGQTLCHDATGRETACPGSGQDAETRPGLPWPEPRFSVHGPVVRDELTGLDWVRDASLAAFPLSWAEALDFAQGLERDGFGGGGPWRLPTRRELRSLLGHAERDPALPAGHPFLGVVPGWHWTATTWAGDPAYAWYVQLSGGRTFFGRKDGYSMVLPVRGNSPVLPATGQRAAQDPAGRDDGPQRGAPWPEPRFEVLGDAVRDGLTGLTWTRDADLGPGPLSWTEAFALPRRLAATAHAGRTDWRLPTIAELESLTDASRAFPALPAGHPFLGVAEVYWSATNSAYEPDWAMALYMHKGAVGVGFKAGEGLAAWCVAG